MTGSSKSRVRSRGRILSLLCVLAPIVLCCQRTKASEQVFPLEGISVFDLPQAAGQYFLLGQRAACDDAPDPNVTKYPRFASDRPVYGKVRFAQPLEGKDAGTVYYFAIDESGGTGKGYDRLYFDLNHDRDLTNDNALAAQKNPPQGAMLNYSELSQQVCFENLALPFPCGSEAARPLEMMPRFYLSVSGYKALSLVTTRVFKGRLEVAGQKCDVLLGHSYAVTGWFDQPWTALRLTPAGGGWHWDWSGGDRLNATHKIAGAFYTFSAAPTGETLTVRPYEGPLGAFEVGPGGRTLDRCEIQGSLGSQKTAVPIGDMTRGSQPTSTRSCRLPIGDYFPQDVTVQYGKLRIGLSNNYHVDGKRRGAGLQPVCGIAIRADKPFVFDFSNKPAVLFASPARDRRVKRGEELSVMAVLIDPVQNFMIRDLSDTTRKEMREYIDPDGSKHSLERELSLRPKVTIARANGEMVTDGVMPFG